MSSATMQDVARRAGVSISTVSYVLSGTRPVSEKTKQIIYAAMEELGYRPHVLARGLASRRSRILGLLCSVPERGLGVTEIAFVTSAADAARDNGYNLVLWTPGLHDRYELEHLTRQGLVDGVIVMEVHERDERVSALRELGTPFSLIGRCADNTGLIYADIDFDRTTHEAVDYLAARGHTTIAFLNQSRETYDSGYGPAVRADRGFLKATREHGSHGVACFSHAAPPDGYRCINGLIDRNPGLTALVAMNDRALPGVMQAIGDRGLRVPEDFSVISLASSARAAEMFVPPLTTFEVPSEELARLAVEQLIRRVEGSQEELPHSLVPCRLIERESAGNAPSSTDGNRR